MRPTRVAGTADHAGRDARIPDRAAGVEGGLPELPRHAHGAGRAPPVARRHRQRLDAEDRRRRGPRGDLLPVPHRLGRGDHHAVDDGAEHSQRLSVAAAHADHVRSISRPGRRCTTSPAIFGRRLHRLQRCDQPLRQGHDRAAREARFDRSQQPPCRVHRLPQPAPRGEVPRFSRQPRRVDQRQSRSRRYASACRTQPAPHTRTSRRVCCADHGVSSRSTVPLRSRACRPATSSSAATRATASTFRPARPT